MYINSNWCGSRPMITKFFDNGKDLRPLSAFFKRLAVGPQARQELLPSHLQKLFCLVVLSPISWSTHAQILQFLDLGAKSRQASSSMSTVVCFPTLCSRTPLSIQFMSCCSDLGPDCTRSFAAWDLVFSSAGKHIKYLPSSHSLL